MKITAKTILISNCTAGIYLRWWYVGWHYFNFQNGYEITMTSQSMDTQVIRMFSVISKIERPTKLTAEYSYKVTLEGITVANIPGFTGLLMAEKVEQYEGGIWREVEITRGDHLIKNPDAEGYILDFEITRKELPYTSSVYQKSIKLYIGDTLCDLDDDEIIPINKQVNDIAEMQDRQSDFTAQFKIRKTRAMKALFELSGEVGVNTTFPYTNQTCRLIQNGVEMITSGQVILDKCNDWYYFVSILSGNKDFFKTIDTLKINDLTLASTDHTWDVATMAGTHAADLDYVYPLLEPSDDAGITPPEDDGDTVDIYGGYIWPFIKVKAIWDEIFSNAGYICQGDILTNTLFTKLHLPIVKLNITNTDKYLYSMWWSGFQTLGVESRLGQPVFNNINLINGNSTFLGGYYIAPYDADYKFSVVTINGLLSTAPTMTIYKNAVSQGEMTLIFSLAGNYKFEYELTGVSAGDSIQIRASSGNTYYYWFLGVIEIRDAAIAYSSAVVGANHLPDISQTDFIKTICNMFGLIPDVTPRDKIIRFWNYLELYDNIPIARDWSAYLSEKDDEPEFKFGDYGQNNYLKYADSEDVVKDNGRGIMQIDDETLPGDKDVVNLPVSTCDEVTILSSAEFSVNVSRIAMNEYNADTATYDPSDEIDPRIVYVDHVRSIGSPAYEKTMGLSATVVIGATTDVTSPKISKSIDVSFSSLISNYSGLSRMLTKTNLRRAKFNLPVYEVAGLKHYIPIYVSQYKAYFYVNKINNYVPGKLCTIDLIKL